MDEIMMILDVISEISERHEVTNFDLHITSMIITRYWKQIKQHIKKQADVNTKVIFKNKNYHYS